MGPERRFRVNTVDPFLKKLEHGYFMSIQQLSISGTPDKIGLINGRFVALELKADNGRVSKLQEFVLGMITKCGGVALVVSPSNWPETKLRLQQLDGEQLWK
jgi:hypothetical protein